MPLIKSASKEAIGDNIREMISSGHPRDQAIAAALDTARRAKRAKGGKVHVGPITGTDPGRTDTIKMNVPDGAYVLPSETISHLGENNTDAGLERAQHLFGPDGEHGGRKSGGAVKSVPCITASGEFVIDPSVVRSIGHGDIAFGHKILDHFVMMMRKDHIKTLASLDPPAQD
jgi:hypothetical protein